MALGLLQVLIYTVLPPDPSVDWSNRSAVNANIHKIDTMAMVMTVFAHFVAVIVGALIARVITKGSRVPAIVIGSIILTYTIVNAFGVAFPWWFRICDIAGVVLSSLMALAISGKKRTK